MKYKMIELAKDLFSLYKVNKIEMNVSDLKPGLYFIQVQTEFGKQILKFIKM